MISEKIFDSVRSIYKNNFFSHALFIQWIPFKNSHIHKRIDHVCTSIIHKGIRITTLYGTQITRPKLANFRICLTFPQQTFTQHTHNYMYTALYIYSLIHIYFNFSINNKKKNKIINFLISRNSILNKSIFRMLIHFAFIYLFVFFHFKKKI